MIESTKQENYNGCITKNESSTREMDFDRDRALIECDLPESFRV